MEIEQHKDLIINTIRNRNPSIQNVCQVLNLRANEQLDKDIPWDKVHPQELQMSAMHDPRFMNGFKSTITYFEHKWNLTKLETPKQIIYIDSKTGEQYRD